MTKTKEVKTLRIVTPTRIGGLRGVNVTIRIKREREDTILIFDPVDAGMLFHYLEKVMK